VIPEEAFLSHASSDQARATSLSEVLVRHRVPLWFSPSQIAGAQQWHDEIGVAIRRCDWFLLLLSPSAIEARWVKRELIFALQNNRYDNRIVPLLYEPCDFESLSWVLPGFQTISFQESLDEGYRDLLKIWNIRYLREEGQTTRSSDT